MIKLFYAVVFGCILALGLPLNAVSLWILLRHHGLRSPNSVLMINLAISDLLLVIFLPMRVYFYATGTWPLGRTTCLVVTLLFRDNIRSSSIFITFISVDRLLAVVYPLRSRHLRTASNAVKGAAVVWLYVLLLNIPEGVNMSKHLYTQNDTICFESVHSNNPRKPFILYFQTVVMIVMLAVNIGCTFMVLRTLRSHLNESAKVNNKVKVMVIFAMNLVIFIICFLPVTFGSMTSLFGSDITAFVCLATANCCLDPLLYYFSLDAFWRKKEDADMRREMRTNDTEFS
ncbi:lysophosphatidic acid receptor 5b [Austrofundulus limnaeus]|uniref:Lysophosphatidic acid receptor 5b n=1 Tax=Austrofundulus limnaeus TaxID=52670 RepID=A0A2I4BRS8_AUSLI|nr:PREDICTED: lysophosphatidic acid receptor 6-like [Austrofundulus limnaeus]